MKKIEQFIDSWTICTQDSGILQLELAVGSILKSIDFELKRHKLQLPESQFQDLIHTFLDKIHALPKVLRMQTLSYLNGGVQREVQRLEYHELKQCFIQHLKPEPWSSYALFIALEAIPATLLILMIASMPGVALAAKQSRSSSSETADLKCRNILKIDYALGNLALQNTKLQLGKLGLNYDALPIQADFSLEKTHDHLDCLAYNLTRFSKDEFNPSEEKAWIYKLSNDGTLMEPLYYILTYAQNKPLRYKIIAKLTHILYLNIQSARVQNAHRLIRILGQAVMAILPDELPASITTYEITRMSDILSLYRRMAEDKSAVNKQSIGLRALLEIEPSIASSPQPTSVKTNSYYGLILGVVTAMMGLLKIFMRVFNRTESMPKPSNPKNPIPPPINTVKISRCSKPSTIQCAPKISLPQVAKPPKQENLNVILSKLNELFLDLIIQNPSPLRWSEFMKKQIRLELNEEKYYFNTQGDGKIFCLSKVAARELAIKYCKDSLGAEEDAIKLNADDVILGDPVVLIFKSSTRTVKQFYAAFFKPLRQLANLYYPMEIELDYDKGDFLVRFNLEAQACNRIEPSSLSAEDFLVCVRHSLKLKGLRAPFSILQETIKGMALPNEREFATIKKEACIIEGKEPRGYPGFFDQNVNAVGGKKVQGKDCLPKDKEHNTPHRSRALPHRSYPEN